MSTICWFLIPVHVMQMFCFTMTWSGARSHLVMWFRKNLGICYVFN